MAMRVEQHAIKGIQRDLTRSKFSNEFAFDAQNIRITARDNNTLLSVTNEKGNKDIPLVDTDGNEVTLEGTVIGYNVLNEYLTLFTTDNNSSDHIYRLHRDGDHFVVVTLFSGDLTLNTDNPIESLGIYEAPDIQKVYWVDGVNQPRVINIMREYGEQNRFDFVQDLQLKETVTITRSNLTSGIFPAGVVQYAFSYYNKYGQESAIFYTSPLHYISFTDRGANAEENVTCSFTITVDNVDTNFDYMRIYSIIRSSIDGTPSVKRIVDIPITGESITYVDTNATGEAMDATELLYIGGENLIAGTMTSKDNTLFLGNIKLNSKTVPKNIRTSLEQLTVNFNRDRIGNYFIKGYYGYENYLSLGSNEITSFKTGETYRFGLQFQDSTGRWSEVVFIDDAINNTRPTMSLHVSFAELTNMEVMERVIASTYMNGNLVTQLRALGFVKVRGVVVYPSLTDREVIAQGVVCPTVYRLGDRINNAPFVQSSWFARPSIPYDLGKALYRTTTESNITFYEVSDLDNFIDNDQFPIAAWKLRIGPRSVRLINPVKTVVNPITQECKVVFNFADDNIDLSGIPLEGTLYPDDGGLVVANPPTYKGYVIHNVGGNWIVHSQTPSENSPAGVWSISKTNVSVTTGDDTNVYTVDPSSHGDIIEFRHNYPIPNNYEKGAEIQTLADNPKYPLTQYFEADLNNYNERYKNYFFIDQSIVTFHSPDVEFDTQVQNLSGAQLKFRIIGYVLFTAEKGSISIQANGTYGDGAPGFYDRGIGSPLLSMHSHKGIGSGAFWIDKIYDKRVGSDPLVGFIVYPWHRNGSLNNGVNAENETRMAVLQSKRISNLRYAGSTIFFAGSWEAVQDDDIHNGITPIQVFNSDEVTALKIDAPENSFLPSLVYYGNIDSVLSPDSGNYNYYIPRMKFINDEFNDLLSINVNDGYPIGVTGATDVNDAVEFPTEYYNIFASPRVPLPTTQTDDGGYDGWAKTDLGKDPVEMKYKTTPHIVFAFNYTNSGKQVILPTNAIYDPNGIGDYGDNTWANYTGFDPAYNMHFPWNTPELSGDTGIVEDGVHQDMIAAQDTFQVERNYPFLWVGELYRDSIPNKFGGNTQEAYINNNWLPAGEPVDLTEGATAITVQYTVGDTFLQRYDCLKTYSGEESTNNVTEVMSFMCETRVNIDGRYDRNRGELDYSYMTPQNFNLMNEVYNQKNTYFTYHALDYSTYENSLFPNTIVWSEEKHNSSTVDDWLGLNMTSSLDLDGDKGEVISLNVFNNEIYCFQKKGLSNILFNSRVQIPTSDNVPIEITNGLKVSGKRYVSNSIGCSNKWSIVETPSGIYFIDNITNSLYIFDGSIKSLSDSLGFRQWISSNNSLEDWNPIDFGNFISHYDCNNNDVYFINKDTALTYSEMLGQFTSFMDYGSTPFMFNIDNDFYAIKDGHIWEQFAGDYNMFYGEYKPYSITWIANQDEPYNKILNNLDYRADHWTIDENGNEVLDTENSFDLLEVWTEYQKGVLPLVNTKGKPSSIKRKFRVWRTNIPRFNTDWNGVKANGRDRINNPWAFVKLSKEGENTDRMELHDVIVHYFL